LQNNTQVILKKRVLTEAWVDDEAFCLACGTDISNYENNIPLYKARTCFKSFEKECGDCPTCWDRRRAYKEIGIIDETKYHFDMSEKYPTYYDYENEEKILKNKLKK
jgi:predicted amidophosphoribosyltransferase